MEPGVIFRKLKGFEVFKIDLEIESYSVGLVQGINLYSRRGMSFTSGVVEINCNFLLTYLLTGPLDGATARCGSWPPIQRSSNRGVA